MSKIPNNLECAYCIRNYTHGGECQEHKNGCLAFKMDPRGCIRRKDIRLKFPLYHDIPFLNTWDNNWMINNLDSEIKITRIHGISWDSKKGNVIVHCNIEYFINEYHEAYTKPPKKFELIKGGKDKSKT